MGQKPTSCIIPYQAHRDTSHGAGRNLVSLLSLLVLKCLLMQLLQA